jgi:hypothetical protein
MLGDWCESGALKVAELGLASAKFSNMGAGVMVVLDLLYKNSKIRPKMFCNIGSQISDRIVSQNCARDRSR